MSKNIEFLNYIYQNARMGIVGIDAIKNDVVDESLSKLLEEQYADYEFICDEAIKLFIKYGKVEKEIPLMSKISTYLMTLKPGKKENSNTKIAKMMIEGSNKGILEITEKLNHYANSDAKITALAKKLLKVEERNLKDLKPFL